MDFKIVPLTKDKVQKAVELLEKVFDINPKDFDYPGKWLPLSLEESKPRKVDDVSFCTYLKYFVLVDRSGKVVGITGIYFLGVDENEAAWIGWLALDKKYRGKGLGKKLVEFVINEARNLEKKCVRLYTSNSPLEERANFIYRNLGFEEIKREKEVYSGKETGYDRIFLELKI